MFQFGLAFLLQFNKTLEIRLEQPTFNNRIQKYQAWYIFLVGSKRKSKLQSK